MLNNLSNITSIFSGINPGWDLFILVFFIVMTVYGVLLGKNRTLAIVLSSYVAYVVAHEFSQIVFEWFSRASSYNNAVGTSSFGAKTITFVAVLIILVIKNNFGRDEEKDITATAITVIYGFLAAGLIMISLFSFMGDSERIAILTSSNLASKVYSSRTIWLIGPLIAITASNVIKGRRR